MMRLRLTTLLLALSTLPVPSPSAAQRAGRVDRRELAGRVRAEFLHAWRGYERHAWGHDEPRLRPAPRAGLPRSRLQHRGAPDQKDLGGALTAVPC